MPVLFLALFFSFEPMPNDVLPPEVLNYAALHTTEESPVLKEINEETANSHPQAHMLSGHVQGRVLSFISKLIQPRYILEIGTFTGYSALCLAEGLAEGGELHTIDINQEDADTALKNFTKAGHNKNIILHVGNAKDIIPALNKEWDLVFIDADKVSYTDYYELVLLRLSQKGLIIADNVLFHGQVLKEPIAGKNAIAIDFFNKHVAADPRVEQIMLTVRDGLLLIKKI